jgi:outer membrane protein assembly factor BamE
MSLRLALLICVYLLLPGCFLMPYRIDVQQGNFIERETIAKLKPGMTRAQVRFILGTPLIADPFNPNRWDYLYYNRPRGRIQDVRRLTLYFEDDKLKRAYADAAVAPTAAEMAAAASAPTRPGAAQDPVGVPFPAAEPAPVEAPKPVEPVRLPSPKSPVLPGRGVGPQ